MAMASVAQLSREALMDRAEAAGLGVATAGHAALLAALSFGFASTRLPVPKSDPIEVSFVDEVGLESMSPTPLAAEPAPLAGPQDAPPEPAMPAPPQLQEVPAPQPEPRLQPQPRTPAPSLRPAPKVQPRPAPPKAAPAPPAKAPPRRNSGGLSSVVAGLSDRPTPSRSADAPAAASGPAVQASLGAEVRRQLKPHWKAPTGADAEQLRTEVVIALGQDGRVADVRDRRHQRPDREQPAAGFAPPGACRPRRPARFALPTPRPALRGVEATPGHLRQEALAMMKRLFPLFLLAFAMPAAAQLSVDVTDESGDDLVIAVPVMPTPQSADTPAGSTEALGRQVAEVVAADLRGSGLFRPVGPGGVRAVPFPEVTAPAYEAWSRRRRGRRSSRASSAPIRDGQLTVGCYLYDVALQSELTRQGYVVAPARLAPRRAQMRRRHLFAPVRREPLLRQPDRLYRRDRPQGPRGSSGSRSWIRTAPTTAS